MFAILVITEIAEGYGARSVSESICTSAGESVLGEYNTYLFKRYGIFALRNDEDYLEKRAHHFIDASCQVGSGFVRVHAKDISVYADKYPALNADLFSSELKKAVLESLAKNGVRSIEHPERKVASLGLPSKMLGFGSRESVLLSGGIFEIEVDKIFEDEYIMKMCSYKNNELESSYLAYETEYILFGYASDEGNLSSMRRSLYAICFAKRMTEAEPLPTDPATLAIVTAKSAIEAESDVDALVRGESIDGMNYESYLRIFLAMLSKDEKIARLMDVMQININCMDGVIFNFKNYSFGFDMNVKFIKRVIVPVYFGNEERFRTVEQTHRYK